jgi:hypothetical protein
MRFFPCASAAAGKSNRTIAPTTRANIASAPLWTYFKYSWAASTEPSYGSY